jgi:hypothetical protein
MLKKPKVLSLAKKTDAKKKKSLLSGFTDSLGTVYFLAVAWIFAFMFGLVDFGHIPTAGIMVSVFFLIIAVNSYDNNDHKVFDGVMSILSTALAWAYVIEFHRFADGATGGGFIQFFLDGSYWAAIIFASLMTIGMIVLVVAEIEKQKATAQLEAAVQERKVLEADLALIQTQLALAKKDLEVLQLQGVNLELQKRLVQSKIVIANLQNSRED